MIGGDLRATLQYLRDLGFSDVYHQSRVPPPPSAGEVAAVGEVRLESAPCAELAKVRDQALACRACGLCESRDKVVFGSGNEQADLMFVGEGPGANEDRQGLPFVGAAGDLLTKMIVAMGWQRSEVYIANVVKCRPPGNRDPHPDEVAACIGFLQEQIRLIRPQVIVALGRVAAQALLQTEESIGRLRGRWFEYAGVSLRATYHPAALLRNAGLKRPTWEDLQVVRDRIRSGVGG